MLQFVNTDFILKIKLLEEWIYSSPFIVNVTLSRG
jgi:hypothetical protein